VVSSSLLSLSLLSPPLLSSLLLSSWVLRTDHLISFPWSHEVIFKEEEVVVVVGCAGLELKRARPYRLASALLASPLLVSSRLLVSSPRLVTRSYLVVLPTLRSHFLPLVCDPQPLSLLAGSSFVLPTPRSCLLAPHLCLSVLFHAGCWIKLC
jgi:hypothetical protein